MATRTAIFALSISLFALWPVAPAQADEAYDCGGSVLVCAWTEAEAGVVCQTAVNGDAICSWSRAVSWNATSTIGLTGSAHAYGEWTIQTCLNADCTPTTENVKRRCEWLVAAACQWRDAGTGSFGPFTLAPGECLTVSVTASSNMTARSVASFAFIDVEGAETALDSMCAPEG